MYIWVKILNNYMFKIKIYKMYLKTDLKNYKIKYKIKKIIEIKYKFKMIP